MSDVILFDLDGTLTDSGPGIIKCVQYALNYMGKPESNPENLRCFVGPPLHQQFMEYGGFTSAEADLAVEQYRERYSTIGIYENEIYKGIPEILRMLKDTGKILAVASSKPAVFVEEILRHFELRGYFDVVVGSELDGSRTAKDEVIEEALRRLGYEKHREQVVMVGDRRYDVEGAGKCGLQCVGAAFGYGGREELEKAGAVFIAETVEDLKILAETDDAGKENVSSHHTGKIHQKNRKKAADGAGRKNYYPRHPKKTLSPDELGKMLWEIFYPMLVHFGCMVLISLLGILFAGMILKGMGSNYMDVVAEVPWLSSIFSALTAISVVVILGKYYQRDKVRLEIKVLRWSWMEGTACALASVGLGLVWNKLITASGIRAFFLRYSEISENTYENQNWFLLVLCVGILASFGEELAFRGLIYQRAKSYFGVGWGIGISAALFGIYHGNVVQFLYAVVLGIFFAVLYEKTGSLWAPVTAHIATNVFNISYEYIVDFLIKRIRWGETLLLVVVVLLAAGSFCYLFLTEESKKRIWDLISNALTRKKGS